jgi:hypothetical protein
LIGALDRPDEGTLAVGGVELGGLSQRELAAHRRRVGFVFERFNLLAAPTVIDNVMAPADGVGYTQHTLTSVASFACTPCASTTAYGRFCATRRTARRSFCQRFIGTFKENARTIAWGWETSCDGVRWRHDVNVAYTNVV